jgi:DNA-binding response OmpR family regulator
MTYAVETVHTGLEGVERATTSPWHAVILDVMLPGLDGFEVLKSIRRKSDVPVLMLTSRGEEADRIAGLEIGADDYLPKTFSTRELLARLRAVTRRAIRPPSGEEIQELVIGKLRVRVSARTAVLGISASPSLRWSLTSSLRWRARRAGSRAGSNS